MKKKRIERHIYLVYSGLSSRLQTINGVDALDQIRLTLLLCLLDSDIKTIKMNRLLMLPGLFGFLTWRKHPFSLHLCRQPWHNTIPTASTVCSRACTPSCRFPPFRSILSIKHHLIYVLASLRCNSFTQTSVQIHMWVWCLCVIDIYQ